MGRFEKPVYKEVKPTCAGCGKEIVGPTPKKDWCSPCYPQSLVDKEKK